MPQTLRVQGQLLPREVQFALKSFCTPDAHQQLRLMDWFGALGVALEGRLLP